MKTVVVVFGNARHGKDTFSDMLASYIESNNRLVRRFAFADGVKVATEAMVGVPHDLEDKSREYYGKPARYWWQWIGTEVARDEIHKDIWVHRAIDVIIRTSFSFYIISDGRFRNELDALCQYLRDEAHVVAVRVVRPDVEVDLSHQSESEVVSMERDLFDKWIDNDGDLAGLQAKAEMLAIELT